MSGVVEWTEQTKKRIRVCRLCGLECIGEAGLRRHVTTIHEKPGVPQVCLICGVRVLGDRGMAATGIIITPTTPDSGGGGAHSIRIGRTDPEPDHLRDDEEVLVAAYA